MASADPSRRELLQTTAAAAGAVALSRREAIRQGLAGRTAGHGQRLLLAGARGDSGRTHRQGDGGGDPLLRANGDFGEEFKAQNDGHLEARIPLKQRRDQVGNFLDVIRGSDGVLHCNAELGAATMMAIKMAVESYRQSKTMHRDGKRERVVS